MRSPKLFRAMMISHKYGLPYFKSHPLEWDDFQFELIKAFEEMIKNPPGWTSRETRVDVTNGHQGVRSIGDGMD